MTHRATFNMVLRENNCVLEDSEKGRPCANTDEFKMQLESTDWSPWSLGIWAPDGKIFNSSGCHCDYSIMGDPARREVKVNWDEALRQLLNVIAEGFSDCENDECDTCNATHLDPTGEDNAD